MKMAKTMELIKSDVRRYAEETGVKLTPLKFLSFLFMPSVCSLCFYRICHYLWVKGLRFPARILYSMNLMLFGADISPRSEIGRSFYMPHPVGCTVVGKFGNRCTLFAQAGIGGGMTEITDIGGHPGCPVVGDNVVLGARSVILGPVEIGSDCKIGPLALILKSLAPGTVVMARTGIIVKSEGKEGGRVEKVGEAL